MGKTTKQICKICSVSEGDAFYVGEKLGEEAQIESTGFEEGGPFHIQRSRKAAFIL